MRGCCLKAPSCAKLENAAVWHVVRHLTEKPAARWCVRLLYWIRVYREIALLIKMKNLGDVLLMEVREAAQKLASSAKAFVYVTKVPSEQEQTSGWSGSCFYRYVTGSTFSDDDPYNSSASFPELSEREQVTATEHESILGSLTDGVVHRSFL